MSLSMLVFTRFCGSLPSTLPILTNESVGETLREPRGGTTFRLQNFFEDIREWGDFVWRISRHPGGLYETNSLAEAA